jgi:hypothetical protein
MIEELFIIIMIFAISLIVFKMQSKTFVLLTAVFGLMINTLSLTAGIPFTPFLQIFFSIIELLLLIYARRMNM